MIMVEQHAHKALRYTDRAIVMRRGRVGLDLTGEEARNRIGDVEQAYLTCARAATSPPARPSSPPSRTAGRASSRPSSVGREDVDGHRGGVALEPAAAVLGEGDAGALDLALAGLAAQLPGRLADLGDAGGADRVALGEQAAAGVDRQRRRRGAVRPDSISSGPPPGSARPICS